MNRTSWDAGYRPKRGALDAVRDLSAVLSTGEYHYIVEADIRGFFDNIDHDHLLEMLERRIDDTSFLNLIRKWLKAGILETDGSIIHPTTGTPQGGIVSPILANIYLHYVLDVTGNRHNPLPWSGLPVSVCGRFRMRLPKRVGCSAILRSPG